MDRKRIQCLSNASQHVHIYLQPFTNYIGRKSQLFPTPLHLTPPYGVAPGTIAVNVTRLERGFNACETTRCIYLSIFNRFPVIQAWSLKVRHFSTFFAHFGLHCVRPWDHRGKCYMDRKRIQCLSNSSQHMPIYLQPFMRYSELLVENCDIFRPHLCLAAPFEFREDLDTHKTKMNGLSCGEESMTICSAVLIQYQRVTDGQKDGRTDVQPISVTCFSIAYAHNNKKDGYRQQNVRQRQKLISIIDYDVCMTFYLSDIVTIALSCTICELFDVK